MLKRDEVQIEVIIIEPIPPHLRALPPEGEKTRISPRF